MASTRRSKPPMNPPVSDYRIAVIQSGWVIAGDFSRTPEIDTLTSSVVISQWGTTKGLGELALSGPTDNTVLFPCGITDVPRASVLFTLRVAPELRGLWPV
jgi:hypothetical protein